VPSLPTWEVGGGGLTAVSDGVWIAGSADPRRATVVRVDPATNELAEEIDLGPGFGADVWIDATSLWVLIFDEGEDPGISLVRIDRTSLDEVARIALPTDWAKQVFGFDGSIWVHGNRQDSPLSVVPDVLFRVDPATNRYLGAVGLPSEAFPLAVDAGGVWQRTDDGVVRVQPERAEVPVELDRLWDQCHCGHIVSDGDGGLWMIGRSAPSHIEVIRIGSDERIGLRDDVEVPDSVLESVAVAFDDEHQTLWLAQYRDTVTPLRLETG